MGGWDSPDPVMVQVAFLSSPPRARARNDRSHHTASQPEMRRSRDARLTDFGASFAILVGFVFVFGFVNKTRSTMTGC